MQEWDKSFWFCMHYQRVPHLLQTMKSNSSRPMPAACRGEKWAREWRSNQCRCMVVVQCEGNVRAVCHVEHIAWRQPAIQQLSQAPSRPLFQSTSSAPPSPSTNQPHPPTSKCSQVESKPSMDSRPTPTLSRCPAPFKRSSSPCSAAVACGST